MTDTLDTQRKKLRIRAWRRGFKEADLILGRFCDDNIDSLDKAGLQSRLRAEGVRIYIGEESGYRVLDECSVVTAPYTVDGEVVGTLGVIGPTRMAYNRIIPLVDAAANLLGTALKSRN